MTLISWSTRGGRPGSGYQRIPQCTTVSTSVEGSRRESVELRRSASMNSVATSSAGGGRESIPAI